MDSARVYIVDEHQSVRFALAERLDRSVDLDVIGHGSVADEVIHDVQLKHPDVVLLEVKRSDGLGLELLRQIASLTDPPLLVVLTTYPSSWEQQAATRAGATCYLLKDIETDDLIQFLTNLV
ncbi:MAG: response regulator [Anaerolineales bacterium]|nr:response regulator [Anaerolineales bacterium]